MCCRYFIRESPELRSVIEAMNRSPLVSLFQERTAVLSEGEIRPTNAAPVIATNRSGDRAVFPMKWGFTGKTLLINARAETAAQKPTFREAWVGHRCIVPASWYFEWEHLTGKDGRKKTGEKYRLHPKGTAITWLCGLYRMEEGLPSFVILTREPSEAIRFIHDRMPLMLPENRVNDWINPAANPAEIIRAAETEIVFEREVSQAE